MSVAVRDPRGWSCWKWTAAVLLVAAGQGGLLWMFSDRSPAVPARPPASSRIQHLAGPGMQPEQEEFLRLIDPAGAVLPSAEGFSGRAWLQPGPVEYRPPDWEAAEHWLDPAITNFGTLAREWSRGGRVHLWREPEQPRVRTARVEVPPVPVRSQSGYRVEGDLSRRALAEELRVPTVEAVEAITNTVLEVLVNARGIPFSAVVLVGSGSRVADRLALDLVRSARFEPVAGVLPVGGGPEPLDRGVFRFYWRTTEPTNSVREASAPGA